MKLHCCNHADIVLFVLLISYTLPAIGLKRLVFAARGQPVDDGRTCQITISTK